MVDFPALRAATTFQEALAALPTCAPDVLSHVVLSAPRELAGQVLAVDATPQAEPGILHVQTLGGTQAVRRGDVVAQTSYSGTKHYGEAENWSPVGVKGLGFYPTHAEALAALPGLAADAAGIKGRRSYEPRNAAACNRGW